MFFTLRSSVAYSLENVEDFRLVVDLELAELLLGGGELLALHVLQHEQQRPLLHLLPGLHAYGADLTGLLEVHLVALVGRQGAAAADLGVDGAGGDQLRGHLGAGERFMIVCEKKVSTSSTARKMMAMVLMSSLFLDFSFTSIDVSSFRLVVGASWEIPAGKVAGRGVRRPYPLTEP